MLNRLSSSHLFIRRNYELLRRFARLRNAIVYEYLETDYYIAVPHINIVQQIETIASALISPPSVLSVATRPVLSYPSNAKLTDIMFAIEKHKCTSIPIYSEGNFSGLLTEDGITKWIVKGLSESTKVDFFGVSATDVLPFESPQNVLFLGKHNNVFELERLFEERHMKKQKIEAVIITENGRPDEPPLGIVTSWDLVKIDIL